MEDSSRPHWGMVIDLAKCVGCDSCTVACKAENRTPPGITDNVVLERETGAYPNVRLEALPRPCMQCENPPCVSVCPVQATYKGDDGIVVIDADRCIGCGKCDRACPMSLPVQDLLAGGTVADAECIQCAACADVCPKGVLRLRMGRMR